MEQSRLTLTILRLRGISVFDRRLKLNEAEIPARKALDDGGPRYEVCRASSQLWSLKPMVSTTSGSPSHLPTE